MLYFDFCNNELNLELDACLGGISGYLSDSLSGQIIPNIIEMTFNYNIGIGIFFSISFYALSSPLLTLLQFFLINMIIPITIAIITTTKKIAPIIIAFANVVSTEPAVFMAVVAIAVTSVPTTVEVVALYILLSFIDYVIASLEMFDI
jgi:hypothetical protein